MIWPGGAPAIFSKAEVTLFKRSDAVVGYHGTVLAGESQYWLTVDKLECSNGGAIYQVQYITIQPLRSE